jgi:putative hydrolase of the HAD superfamily
MIPIFDLDDTLYDELTYVRSGFRAVATWGADRFGWDAAISYTRLNHLLETEGRGRIFNLWLNGRGSVREALQVYRHHSPDINLWESAVGVLNRLSDHSTYLVTDGHKIVQANKLVALGISSRFRHAYITHRYGIAKAKPSTYCFALIRSREQCAWEDLVYVGDNPAKDFVNLNKLGVHTVRVLTGQHLGAVAAPGFDAQHRIRSLYELPDLLAGLRL